MGQEGSKQGETQTDSDGLAQSTPSRDTSSTSTNTFVPFTPIPVSSAPPFTVAPPIVNHAQPPVPVEAVTLARQRPKASFAPPTASTFHQPPIAATVLHSLAQTSRTRKVPALVVAASSAVKKAVTHGDATIAYLGSLECPTSPLGRPQVDVVSKVKKQIESYREMSARHREEQAKAMKLIFDQQLLKACNNQEEDDDECEHQSKKPCVSHVEQFTTPPTVPLSPTPFWSPGATVFPSDSDYGGAQFQTMRDDATNIESYFADEAKELEAFSPAHTHATESVPMTDVDEDWLPPFPHPSVNTSPVINTIFDPSDPIHRRTIDLRSTKVYLENLRELSVMQELERSHREGRISFDSVRQSIGFLKEQLQPDDYQELLGPFSSMSLASTTSEDDSSSSSDSASVATDKSSSVIQAALKALPTFSNELLPIDAAPDDADGVPRFRVTMFFSSPNRASAIAQRHQSVDEIIQHELANPSYVEKDPFATDDSPLCIYRMMQANVAHERMSGYSQKDMVELYRAIGQRIQFKFVRKDHVKSLHKIMMAHTLQQRHEGHLYQVRINRDGSETYCLVHFVKNFVDGVFSQGVMSMIPLPCDPEHPPPPYVEGVDLPVETLLYGYKPPVASETNL